MREAARALEAADERARQVRSEHNEELELTVADVRELFSEMSGIPSKDLNSDEATRSLGLEGRLREKIFGQDDVLGTIADAVLTAKAGLNNPEAPIGSFIAVGSSGVGKTYSAECLAEDLFDDADALTVFDMSEFMGKTHRRAPDRCSSRLRRLWGRGYADECGKTSPLSSYLAG